MGPRGEPRLVQDTALPWLARPCGEDTEVFGSDGGPLVPLVPGRQRVLGRGWESVCVTSVWRAQNVAYDLRVPDACSP